MEKAICPECDADIRFTTKPTLQQRVICHRCRVALVVIGLMPIVLDWAFLDPIEKTHRSVDLGRTNTWNEEDDGT